MEKNGELDVGSELSTARFIVEDGVIGDHVDEIVECLWTNADGPAKLGRSVDSVIIEEVNLRGAQKGGKSLDDSGLTKLIE